MKRQLGVVVSLIMGLAMLAGCSNGPDASQSIHGQDSVTSSVKETDNPENKEDDALQKAPQKEVTLCKATFMMDENWLVIQNNENDASIYFQESKPDPVYDAISIYLIPNVLDGGKNWDFAEQYMELLETQVVPQFFEGETVIKEYNKDKTPGRLVTGQSRSSGLNGTCYWFMANYSDCIMIMYYHSDKGVDYSSRVQEMVDNMELSFDGFVVEKTEKSSSFTNKFGTPTTRCAHAGCTNYIASSGDTNCCTRHSNKCLNCGKYIDEDATYCMDCLADSLGGK